MSYDPREGCCAFFELFMAVRAQGMYSCEQNCEAKPGPVLRMFEI